MAFLLLAFIGFLTLIILIVHLVHRQDDIKRSVNHLFFMTGRANQKSWGLYDWHSSLNQSPSGPSYSEVPDRRACSLRFFRFSFHPARNFSCNKQKIPTCSFINLLSKKIGRVEFFPNPSRLFQSALLLGTSEYEVIY